MAEDASRSRLGRGLAALIGDVGQEPQTGERGRSQRRVPIAFLHANPNNPRKAFAEADLADLSASIKERGVIQPIVVRGRGQDDYEIIAGERRWRAAQRAGLHEVPVVIVEVTDAEALELAIIENVQRADLNAIEEAAGYQALIDGFKHSQDDVARIVGKSRSHVANTLRLLKLSDGLQAHVREGRLSAGHARLLVGRADADALARAIIEQGLNVRQAEALTRTEPARPAKAVTSKAAKDADTVALEKRLSDALGLVVAIDHRGEGGTVQIRYRDLDQLDLVLARLEG